jgi:5-(carboxyamino)imidazole ribonucleotide mutase
MAERTPLVAVLMGSASDAPALEPCLQVLRKLDVPFEVRVLSAHRTPRETAEYVDFAEERGLRVLVCAAGMAAHLAGICAAHTVLPVIGLPVAAGPLNGQDALLSTAMMPPGVPVATVAINGAANAAWLAAQILATSDTDLRERVRDHRRKLREEVLEKDRNLPRG